MPEGLLEHLRRFLRNRPARRYWIGYSGGVDSHVLLHLCARLRPEYGDKFVALHVNHQLHCDAVRWQDHCRRVCDELGLPFQALSVDASARPGESPEAAARAARYQAFAGVIQAGEALLLAQHQDDQAETVLLQLLRGAGPTGLAGMAVEACLGEGRLLRPLLDVEKQELLDYARQQGLEWIDDPSNLDTNLDRNFLRHRVLPLLRERWPSCARTLARSARHCGEAEALLQETLAPLVKALVDTAGRLDAAALARLDPGHQNWVLRVWLKKQGLLLPSEAFLHRIVTEVLPAREDRMPQVTWKGGEVRRYRGKLYALPPQPQGDPAWRCDWDGGCLLLPDGTRLEVLEVQGRGIAQRHWHRSRIEVGYRRGGESCRLPGRHRRPLKKLLQECGLPPWLRPRLPLIYLNGELAAVASLWVCEPFAAAPGERGLLPRWSQWPLNS